MFSILVQGLTNMSVRPRAARGASRCLVATTTMEERSLLLYGSKTLRQMIQAWFFAGESHGEPFNHEVAAIHDFFGVSLLLFTHVFFYPFVQQGFRRRAFDPTKLFQQEIVKIRQIDLEKPAVLSLPDRRAVRGRDLTLESSAQMLGSILHIERKQKTAGFHDSNVVPTPGLVKAAGDARAPRRKAARNQRTVRRL
jgi:hypothetical protein